MIHIEISHYYSKKTGALGTTARAGKHSVKRVRGSPIAALCRKLLEIGEDPNALVEVRRRGSPDQVFKPIRLREWSHWTVIEGDHQSLRLAPWKPMTCSVGKPGSSHIGQAA